MDFQEFMKQPNEKPLDHLVTGGGFCGIFRTIACVGDSLSSGEFESRKNGENSYHDYFEYSWGQYLARDAGCSVYNFSRGGMTASEYCKSFAEAMDFWNVERRAQAYIIAMGANDISRTMEGIMVMGTIEDAKAATAETCPETFAGYYAHIIRRYRQMQPKAKFFLMTMPRSSSDSAERAKMQDYHAELLHQIADIIPNCYVLDFRRYAPLYDEEFKKNFQLGGHLNAAGYRLTALMVESYIDYIIRNHPDDFRQVGFIGKPFSHEDYE